MTDRWYLVHTKPRQERVALDNLERQGVAAYLPLRTIEAATGGARIHKTEPLFPRYLFIAMDGERPAVSWTTLRSTRGVNRLVCFGTEPARVDAALIAAVKAQEAISRNDPVPLFAAGHRVTLTDRAYAGLEGIYQMADGDRRAIVLIEILSRKQSLAVPLDSLRRLG